MTDKHVYILRDNNGDMGATPHVLRVNYQKWDKSVPYELPPLTVQYGVHFDEGGYSMFRSFDWDPKLLFALEETFFVTSFSDFSNTSPHFIIHDLSGKKKHTVPCSLVPTPLKAETLEGPIGA